MISENYLTKEYLDERTSYYQFFGHLGDQDLFTLIYFDHPSIFYVLPCQWNRQLCQYWGQNGYASVFENYFNCPPDIRLWHANCHSSFPNNLTAKSSVEIKLTKS